MPLSHTQSDDTDAVPNASSSDEMSHDRPHDRPRVRPNEVRNGFIKTTSSSELPAITTTPRKIAKYDGKPPNINPFSMYMQHVHNNIACVYYMLKAIVETQERFVLVTSCFVVKSWISCRVYYTTTYVAIGNYDRCQQRSVGMCTVPVTFCDLNTHTCTYTCTHACSCKLLALPLHSVGLEHILIPWSI